MPTWWQKLGHFKMSKKHYVHRGCSSARRVCVRARCFLTSLKWRQFSTWPCITNSKHHAKLFWFRQILHYLEFSRSKMADKWSTCHNLHMVLEIIQTCMWSTMGKHTSFQNLASRMLKKYHVEWAVVG